MEGHVKPETVGKLRGPETVGKFKGSAESLRLSHNYMEGCTKTETVAQFMVTLLHSLRLSYGGRRA